MKYGIMKVWAMMFTSMMCYVDGGEGGGEGGEGGGETLLAGKYKDVAALEAGYTELNTAFSGKDELHNAVLAGYKSPEEFTPGEEWGNDNAMDNRMMSVFQEVAKEHNMSQGMYEGLVNGMVEMQTRVAEADLIEVQKSIPNFDVRANALGDTALKYLRPDQAGAIDTLLTSKESFEAMEVLMGQLRGGTLPNSTTMGAELSGDALRAQIKNLNPSDSGERNRLLDILNSQGGEDGGKLV